MDAAEVVRLCELGSSGNNESRTSPACPDMVLTIPLSASLLLAGGSLEHMSCWCSASENMPFKLLGSITGGEAWLASADDNA